MNRLASQASALLDPVESVLGARPLRSWRDAQKESLRQRFAALHRAWSAEWIPARHGSANELEVQVGEPDDASGTVSGDGARWSFAASPRRAGLPNQNVFPRDGREASQAAVRAIADRMFASDASAANASMQESAKVAAAVARAAWDDWLQRIDTLVPGIEPEGVQAGSARPDPWSGALCVRWSWCGGLWLVVLPHAAVSHLLAGEAETKASPIDDTQRAPKERLDRVLTGQTLPLRVMLEGVELNLGQLQELRPGDVVPLEHALDAPAQVVGADGTPVCDGWLGQLDGRIAIELALPHAPKTAAATAVNTHSSKERKP